MKSPTESYLSEINYLLTCPRRTKRKFLQQMQDEIFLFCADHGCTDYEQLTEQFGPPEEVAQEFMAELRVKAVNDYTRIRKRLLLLILAVILTAAVFVSMLAVRSYFARREMFEDGYLATVTYEKDPEKGMFGSALRQLIVDSVR